MGGEKHPPPGDKTGEGGSPPHGRGKVQSRLDISAGKGITPAWAGKRVPRPSWSYGVWDHPRMGGEKPFDNPKIDNCEGSPPHGRGKGLPKQNKPAKHGITPAWAGKSQLYRTAVACTQDHPRMGGEKVLASPLVLSAQGSPPHGRGKGRTACKKERNHGITPAWAGKRKTL